MIRYVFLFFGLMVVFSAVPAHAQGRVFLGGDSEKQEGSTAPLFLKKDSGRSSSKSEKTPLIFNSTKSSRSKNEATTLYNSQKSSSSRTLYGTKDPTKTAKSGSALDMKLAMLAEQNRKADYDIMQRESAKTKAKIERNQQAREARRAAEAKAEEVAVAPQDAAVRKTPFRAPAEKTEDVAEDGQDKPVVKKVFVYPTKDTTPKKTFNSYQ